MLSEALDHLGLACEGKGLHLCLTVGQPRIPADAGIKGRHLAQLIVRKPGSATPLIEQGIPHHDIDQAAHWALQRLLAVAK